MLHEHIWEIMPDVWSEFSFPQKEKSQSGKLWHVHREIHCHRARSEKIKIMGIIYLLSTVTSDLFFRNWVSNDSPHWAASLCPTYFWWSENKAVPTEQLLSINRILHQVLRVSDQQSYFTQISSFSSDCCSFLSCLLGYCGSCWTYWNFN